MNTKEKPNHHQEMLVALDEWWETRRQPTPPVNRRNWLLWLLPTPGNIIFTLLAIGGILWAQSVGAITLGTVTATTQSIGTIPYQGRLADAAGNPLTNTVNMGFRLYNGASGGAPLWTEQWTGSNGVQVSDGLFNVMLGSLTTIEQGVITGNSNLFLGITVGTDDEMTPRVQLGSVPYAVQALSVPDGSITSDKLSPEINLEPPDGSITQEKAPFAPKVYRKAFREESVSQTENPIIYTTWFHGGADGIQSYDLSDIFTHIDAVSVTRTRNSGGTDQVITFTITDDSGVNAPIPSQVTVRAYNPASGALSSWVQGYVVVIGR